MEIEEFTIQKYLRYVTSYIEDDGAPPDNVIGYHDYVMGMKKAAIREGEYDILLLGIDYMLSNPQTYTPDFETVHYIFDADEMEELLRYIREVAYPDAPPLNPETIKDVKIVDVARSL
jgi:hypothetical protein